MEMLNSTWYCPCFLPDTNKYCI